MLHLNRAEIAQAIAELMVVKGKTAFTLDETIVPTINIGDIADTPYLNKYGLAVSRRETKTAGAATFAYQVASPAPNKVLQLLQICANNNTGAAVGILIAMMTATNIAGIDTPGTVNKFMDVGSQIAAKLVGSSVLLGLDAASSLGSLLRVVTIPASSSFTWDLPGSGIFLYGNDEGGVPGVAVIGSAFNQTIEVTFGGREWPLPGQ